MPLRIERATRAEDVVAAQHLFDGPARPEAVERFLSDPGHHLLLAYEDERPVGMVSGVELTHPDKGTEMFLYELSVDPAARGQGTGTALVRALADLAREHGCYGMWVLTEDDNAAALATYAAAGGRVDSRNPLLLWTF